MPIRPEMQRRYPGGGTHSKEWQAIRQQVLARSKGRCEWREELIDDCVDSIRCEALQGQPHPITGATVVLTVAHLDHDPANNDMANLRHLCQRCHNRHDAPHRAKTRRRRRGQLQLFEGYGAK